MAETSRSRVTITLGRSGQVVKRAGHTVDGSFFPNSHPTVGSKRSVRDRLGSSSDSAVQSNSKRQRQDGSRLNLRASNSIADIPLGKDDLRFKLRHKNILEKNQSNDQHYDGDLRDMLSRPSHSSATNQGSRQPLPELDSTRHRFSGVRDGRPLVPEPRTARPLLTESRNGRPYPSELTDDRQLLQLKESGHLRSESNGSGIYGHMPPRRSDTLSHVDSLRSSYSPWNLDSLRRRSPGTSRGLSSPRRNEEPERRHALRAYDESKATSYVSKDAFEHPRPMNSAAYGAKTAQNAEPAKLRVPLHPPIGLLQKSVNSVDDHPSVDSFLHSLGLDKYAINFKAEEVDMYALRQMGDNDLKELGIPMGPRKKILLTMLSRSKRQM